MGVKLHAPTFSSLAVGIHSLSMSKRLSFGVCSRSLGLACLLFGLRPGQRSSTSSRPLFPATSAGTAKATTEATAATNAEESPPPPLEPEEPGVMTTSPVELSLKVF
ncbi:MULTISPECIES: hypothetical protein [unclassified Pseudomonas]|uniref:hypothetical protein n=1 Tax=unclassified Pseudomonas TaxID=196821 RepID=UPI00117A5546|nr:MULTISPECIES: hypothetical protein [unclassified Pseudomonas]